MSKVQVQIRINTKSGRTYMIEGKIIDEEALPVLQQQARDMMFQGDTILQSIETSNGFVHIRTNQICHILVTTDPLLDDADLLRESEEWESGKRGKAEPELEQKLANWTSAQLLRET